MANVAPRFEGFRAQTFSVSSRAASRTSQLDSILRFENANDDCESCYRCCSLSVGEAGLCPGLFNPGIFESFSACRTARPRPREADDGRRKSYAADKPVASHSQTEHTRLQLVERGASRCCLQRHHGVSGTGWPGGDV